MKKFINAKLALAGMALAAFGSSAFAGAGQEPGSLLVYPIFDNTRAGATFLTVTNTNGDMTPQGNLFAGTVDVHFVYINGSNCQEFDRVRRLTPKDTITVVTRFDNPNQTRGYVYAYAKRPLTGAAIKFDHLIGSSLVFEGMGQVFENQPYVFAGGAALAEGANTDLDGDGRRDLNGLEYEQAPDEIHVPRFFGQGDLIPNLGGVGADTSLVLISLAGKQFDVTLNFLVYNDNEEVFSSQYTFRCWDRTSLLNISGLFSNGFLLSTNHNQNEIFGNGMMLPESGWYSIDGGIASSTAAVIVDPAFLALQIEGAGKSQTEGLASGSVSCLPFVTGEQANGDLINLSIFPDQN